jgi:SAM-dependent methyltransferase
MDRLQELSQGFVGAKILLAASELRLFDQLADEGASAAEVARGIRGTERGTEILLDALVALELIDKRAGRYHLRAEYAERLTEAAPDHFPALLRHRNRLLRRWAYLEEVVRGERPPVPLPSVLEDREANENFILAMASVGSDRPAVVANRLELDGVRRFADVGGGPGHYLAEIARRVPEAEGWLIDLPLTLGVAERLLRCSPARERLHLVEWDFFADPAPDGLPSFDLVFVSQVLHAASPDANRELLEKLFALIAPGGRLVVQENTVDEDRTGPAAAALFAVNMLAMTDGGRTYTEEEIHAWGRAAGFEAGPGERIDERSYLVRLRRPR